MQRPNIAVRILTGLGAMSAIRAMIPAMIGSEAPVLSRPTGRRSRYGRNVQTHLARKEEFNEAARTFEDPFQCFAKHTKLARQAATGTIGLPGGRRGMQVRRVDGVLKITT